MHFKLHVMSYITLYSFQILSTSSFNKASFIVNIHSNEDAIASTHVLQIPSGFSKSVVYDFSHTSEKTPTKGLYNPW